MQRLGGGYTWIFVRHITLQLSATSWLSVGGFKDQPCVIKWVVICFYIIIVQSETMRPRATIIRVGDSEVDCLFTQRHGPIHWYVYEACHTSWPYSLICIWDMSHIPSSAHVETLDVHVSYTYQWIGPWRVTCLIYISMNRAMTCDMPHVHINE